ncbi:hypothetical protein SAMN05421863_103334 [Nitrosomonas communis]|uniref:Uncharacterized protein n=1 Tax=Nitrosomonas communis TaxID=44574 RepID=A0A1I4RK72_9PROT|nr:hypothetical protein SAMN05421863_103334 [Nitrosomonas communis]
MKRRSHTITILWIRRNEAYSEFRINAIVLKCNIVKPNDKPLLLPQNTSQTDLN